MAFTLEQLRGFVAVAEELHFSRAAARLAMTQPPLSRQIQKLERAVGAQLLIRDNRRVTLTAAGEVFLVEARRLLSLAETAPGCLDSPVTALSPEREAEVLAAWHAR